jgi:hypothetical protein
MGQQFDDSLNGDNFGVCRRLTSVDKGALSGFELIVKIFL